MIKGTIHMLGVAIALAPPFLGADTVESSAPCPLSPQAQQLSQQLETLAAELSSCLADNEARALLSTQVKASARKNVVVLRDFLGAAAGQGPAKETDSFIQLRARVYDAEAAMKECRLPIPRLEIKLPVKAHLDLVNSSDTVYVAVAPLQDESEVKSITAFSKGERMTLDAAEPPKVPTFVIAPAESESADPDYPLKTSDKPGEEQDKAQVADPFVGIIWIKITDDHESWTCGDPEIYVKIYRWDPSGTIVNSVNLPGVNDEHVWYWLADPNSTYRFVTTGFSSSVQFQIWEADSGTHGGDDHVGTITVNWTTLPFGAYSSFSGGHAQLYIDKD